MKHNLAFKYNEYPLDIIIDVERNLTGGTTPPRTAFDAPPDFEGTLQYLLCSTYNDHAGTIFNMRYKEKMGLSEIGSILHISGKRVRQILEQKIRFLRQPENYEMLIKGIMQYYRDKEINAVHLATLAYSTPEVIVDDSEIVSAGKVSIPIETIPFSARVYNAFKRGGKNTVDDLLAMSYREVMSLKGFGTNSFAEAVQTLENAGYETPWIRSKPSGITYSE